ncbi:MAG: hypothetical protein ACP5N2_06705 [Candidatus Nanoarchaeia archaeon]
MANFKLLTYFFGAAFLIVLLLLLFTGKKIVYVCYDGTEQAELRKCPAVPPLTITQKLAEEAVTTFANAYALPKGDRASVVNVYRMNSSWKSELLFSNIKTQEVNRVLVNIDGKTSTVTCLEGCDYLGLNVSS